MQKLPNRDCQTCNESYSPPREKSSYCSRSCQVTGKNRTRKGAPVILTCKVCEEKFEVPFVTRNNRECCSRHCGVKLAMSRVDKTEFGAAISRGKIGKTHRGTPHSEETKKVLSEKAKIRLSVPENNPMFGKERSEESRQKQSKTRSQRIVDGAYAWKTESVNSAKGGTVLCRSSWEKDAVNVLDKDETVSKFTNEPFSISYRLNGIQRHYIPDFLVEHFDGRKVLVEVKPSYFITAVINVAKFEAAREYCKVNAMEFQIWTEETLGDRTG